jgi:hypothetical protein
MTDPFLNPSLKDLFRGISADVQLLASHTVALARIELSAAASKLAWSGIALLVSVFIAIAGAAVLISALVLILIALGVPAWAAAIIVGVVLTLGGGLSARYFVSATRAVELDLKETRQSLRETMEWLKLQTGS